MEFVHLHVHSHYSFLDGASTIENLVAAAAANGMKAVALTDHGNLHGAYEFYKLAKASGVKPIPGIEAYISPTTRRDKSMGSIETAAYHLLLLAMNAKGWHNLIKLSSRSFLEGFYYRPRIDRELLSEFNEGLVCCTACLGGEIPSALLRGDEKKAKRIAGEYLDIFGKERFFFEMMNQGYPEQARVNPLLVAIARGMGVELVGTNDVHFLRREDKTTHEILTCIATGRLLSSENKMEYSPELYFKAGDEMKRALSEWPQAFGNTVRIAEMCDCRPDYSRKHLPAFKLPGGETAESYLDKLAWEGLARLFGGRESIPAAYSDRLKWELQVIKAKGYSSYFLIINDCIQFARRNSIPASPRGSGVATLLGYALNLTDVDPLRYGLLFERFTDPQRQEDPDIDLDICQEGRAKVLRYVRDTYGHVAQIITFGTLKARAAIRDVGRVMDVPLDQVDRIAKLVPEGPKAELRKAIEEDGELKGMYESDEQIRRLIDHGLNLEGLVRHSGVHAAGVVICDSPLDDVIPIYRQSDSDETITQWDGVTCGKVGMMKMDFLGLRTLTIIQRARDLVRARTGQDVDPERLPLDDQEVFDLFRRGDTDGVFQFESEGMKGVLTQMKPNRIEDLIAANAMYRPGPMKLIPAYCNRKHGKEAVPKLHPKVDALLAETYGIMVYQEQVMQVINLLGNIPLNRALTGIKAISKKEEKVLLGQKGEFVNGASANGVAETDASAIFDLIMEFAGYGFNKAHSTRYAIVAYQTAYFKVHYPREFLAATLTYESADRDKVVQYMAEARRMGVTIGSPDVNVCDSDFVVDGDRVRFGLAAVKGVGQKAVEAIVEGRAKVGRFKNLFHFCRSVDLHAVNKTTVDALIRCGAFDSLGGGHRAGMLDALEVALQSGQRHAADVRRGQMALFDRDEEQTGDRVEFPSVPSWSREETLAAERETLGFYVTSHPLERYSRVIGDLNFPRRFSLGSASNLRDSTMVGFGCIVSNVRLMVARKGKSSGKKMAMLSVEDLGGKCEAVLFPGGYETYAKGLAADRMLYLTGVLQLRNDRVSVIVEKLEPIESALENVTESVVVRCPGYGVDEPLLGRIKETFARFPGKCGVAICIRPENQNEKTIVIKPHGSLTVGVSAELLAELETMVGARNIFCKPRRPAPPPRRGWERRF